MHTGRDPKKMQKLRIAYAIFIISTQTRLLKAQISNLKAELEVFVPYDRNAESKSSLLDVLVRISF